ncbi:T9SS ring complex lipoprotein PorK/GldK [Polluticaenibacter yanchengensis]|uniref:SUMF1/EgtB/PvdO family nonheme iron enzyme n=1 Tax=Polluticaenibacter yanchengensis TaxID=3014562 RepID=A0ABT4ULC6_9BACT|nr:SUMF1/EgtB/PvdO family nonheme iron enzyme [Chitinophagaceae bacterium LY-5]
MKKSFIHVTIFGAAIIALSSCKSGSKGRLPDDGQVHGVANAAKINPKRPLGMVQIPSGTFHMGPSDEDLTSSLTAKNKQVSITGFFMDQTEVTNNQYRQFVNWTRDSIAAKILGAPYVKQVSGEDYVDWTKTATIKWSDNSIIERLDQMIVPVPDRIYGRKDIDPEKIVYKIEYYDLKEAAKVENKGIARSKFIVKDSVKIYPDTLVWMRDFSYSYNEPMAKKYFYHPAFGSYPVVGVSWKQANAFCNWKSVYQNAYLVKKGFASESDFYLPTEAQWEYAARGGRSQMPYPWGGMYIRNQKGCLLANFKPGRGNYPEDGGFYTVRADAYWPNDYGLYNMAGNVAEWTGSLYYEGAYTFQHDMNPDIRYNAKDSDPPRMKRKVLRGGSWKDIGYFLKNSTRTYEYQDSAKSYIGFRTVIDIPTFGEGTRR